MFRTVDMKFNFNNLECFLPPAREMLRKENASWKLRMSVSWLEFYQIRV